MSTQTWRQITTAPHDGTPVLLYSEFPPSPPRPARQAYLGAGYWHPMCHVWDDGWGRTIPGTVTHWMPLPEPPVSGDGASAPEITEAARDMLASIHQLLSAEPGYRQAD